MPSLSFDAQKILEELSNFDCEIQTLPSLTELPRKVASTQLGEYAYRSNIVEKRC